MNTTLTKVPKLYLVKHLFNDSLSLTQQVNVLKQLNLSSITGEELADIASEILTQSHLVHGFPNTTVDLVGTGGDSSHSFNISTTASLLIAASGYPVAKHGNRSVTSRCGSFDMLVELGIPLPTTPLQAIKQMQHCGITFLFAPYFHPQFQKIASARKKLAQYKIKTIFNILGPLLNPARVKNYVIGVYTPALIEPMINALKLLGVQRAIVLHGAGMDEASISQTTEIATLKHGFITFSRVNAQEFGFECFHDDELRGGDAFSNAKTCQAILNNQLQGAKRASVIFNAAIVINLIDDSINLKQAITKAGNAISNGTANKLLQHLKEQTLCS